MLWKSGITQIFERIRVLSEDQDLLVGVLDEDTLDELAEEFRLGIGPDRRCLPPELLDASEFPEEETSARLRCR